MSCDYNTMICFIVSMPDVLAAYDCCTVIGEAELIVSMSYDYCQSDDGK